MTHAFKKSELAGLHNFDVTVAAYANDARTWRAHMERVEADIKNPPRSPGLQHMAYPRPVAHPLVMAAINEAGDADYKVVDDDPTPEQVLRRKKDDLISEISRTETEALSYLVAPGRARFYNMRAADIIADDQRRASKLRDEHDAVMAEVSPLRQRELVLAEATALVQGPDNEDRKLRLALLPKAKQLDRGEASRLSELRDRSDKISGVLSDLDAYHASERPKEDTKFLADYRELQRKQAAIGRRAAQAQHDIEDLTVETIDAWTTPSFTD